MLSEVKIKVPKLIPDGYVAEFKAPSKNANNFSNWFQHVENCGIAVPKSQVFEVPLSVQRSFYMENEAVDYANIAAWLESTVVPHMTGHPQFFIKNGAFSNKFNFKHCLTNKYRLVNDVIEINWASLMFDTGGIDELVLREVIQTDERITPCIYNGMPLRSEFRVFYDYDKREVLYSVNYWDYEYCRPHLRSRTDQIVFDAMRDVLCDRFVQNREVVEALVAKAMEGVSMVGRWSVDILLDELGQYWLIDMAEAERSAYWDPKHT